MINAMLTAAVYVLVCFRCSPSSRYPVRVVAIAIVEAEAKAWNMRE